MPDKNIVSFDAPEEMFAKIEKIKVAGGYVSRSEAVRDIVRRGLEVKK